jgi:mannonate dehydratase
MNNKSILRRKNFWFITISIELTTIFIVKISVFLIQQANSHANNGGFMQIATVLTPLEERNLAWAAQVGADGIVLRYAGDTQQALAEQVDRVRRAGLQVAAVEGYLPIENIKLANDHRDADLAALKRLVTWMGELRIPILCYNFMAGGDWTRTTATARDRGGALVTGFRLADVPAEARDQPLRATTEQMWNRLEHFLQQLIPVAEAAEVKLAMHPDDPPVAALNGYPRIMANVESFDRLLQLSASEANTICFCQGTFAEMGVDIPATIKHFGSAISYVHFRDIRGVCDDFVETFHDNGQTDMAAAMQAYCDIDYRGFMRPDHVPQLAGEEAGEPGYTMLGRLFAIGYLRGLIHATR